MNFRNGKLPDSAFKAGESKPNYEAPQAKISGRKWCGSSMKTASWLQVDLGEVIEVCHIIVGLNVLKIYG